MPLEILMPTEKAQRGGVDAGFLSPSTLPWLIVCLPHPITGKSWSKMLMQGRCSVSLSLCDFRQSRLLINFQIINVKVIVTPFLSGADKPAPINIPVSGCRSGRPDSIPMALFQACCRCHVNFSPGGSQTPSKSVSLSAGEKPFNGL